MQKFRIVQSQFNKFMIKEIIFFSFGDSNKISTWSNVPFLFCRELEKKSIVVRRINIEANPQIRHRFNSIIYRIYCKIWPQNICKYERSWLFSLITNYKIKKAITKYKCADLCIFCTFSFYNKYSKIPSVLFCDWTFDILIRERLNRNPYFVESLFIKRENSAINNADLVISLFPECADKMKADNPNANISYLGNNVVNSVYDGQIDEEKIISDKYNHKRLLFIGNQNNLTYLETARKLVKAFALVKNKIDNVELHIIGIDSSTLGFTYDGVSCYGYLHKEYKEECDRYYNLIIQSSLIINVTPLWAGYSSIIEAMFYYTPVLVSPFKDFVREFGEDIDFGMYNYSYEINDIADGICAILSSNDYIKMARKAHYHTKDYTWENYVNRMLNLVHL